MLVNAVSGFKVSNFLSQTSLGRFIIPKRVLSKAIGSLIATVSFFGYLSPCYTCKGSCSCPVIAIELYSSYNPISTSFCIALLIDLWVQIKYKVMLKVSLPVVDRLQQGTEQQQKTFSAKIRCLCWQRTALTVFDFNNHLLEGFRILLFVTSVITGGIINQLPLHISICQGKGATL